MMIEGGMYEEAVKENKSRDLSIRANNPALTWWARWSSIITPALITVGIGITGYLGDRYVTHVDKLAEAQIQQSKEQTQALNAAKAEVTSGVRDVQQSVISLRGDMNVMNSHFTDTSSVLNSRIDALSNWTKKNADDIDKLRDYTYKNK